MNATLSTAPGRHDHPPQPVQPGIPRAATLRRLSPLDRLALHVGIALIRWGRRPETIQSRERRATRVEQQLARVQRERHVERTMRLTLPPR